MDANLIWFPMPYIERRLFQQINRLFGQSVLRQHSNSQTVYLLFRIKDRDTNETNGIKAPVIWQLVLMDETTDITDFRN